jgi:hypothetical protein
MIKKFSFGIIGIVALVLAAVVVVKVFPPDKPETINTVEQSKAVKPGLAVNATPEELFKVALPYQFV